MGLSSSLLFRSPASVSAEHTSNMNTKEKSSLPWIKYFSSFRHKEMMLKLIDNSGICMRSFIMKIVFVYTAKSTLKINLISENSRKKLKPSKEKWKKENRNRVLMNSTQLNSHLSLSYQKYHQILMAQPSKSNVNINIFIT